MINFLRYHNQQWHDTRPYMPFRSDAEKKLIVASDYEFLAEALEHRKRALNLSDGKRLAQPWRIPLNFRLIHDLAEIFWYCGNRSHLRLYHVPQEELNIPKNGGVEYYSFYDSRDPSSEVIEEHPEFNYWELSDIASWYDKQIYDAEGFPKADLERIRNYQSNRAPLSANDILALYKACSMSELCGMPLWEGDYYESDMSHSSQKYYAAVEEYDWDEELSGVHYVDPNTGEFNRDGLVYGEQEETRYILDIPEGWYDSDQIGGHYARGSTTARLKQYDSFSMFTPAESFTKPFCVLGAPRMNCIYLLSAHTHSVIRTNLRNRIKDCDAYKFFQERHLFSFNPTSQKYQTGLNNLHPLRGNVDEMVKLVKTKAPYFTMKEPLQEGEEIEEITSYTTVYLETCYWFWDLKDLDGYTIDASRDFGQVDVHFEG